MKGISTLDKVKVSDRSTVDPRDLYNRYVEAMNDDLNSPMVISALFDWVRIINQLYEGQQLITAVDLDQLKTWIHTIVFDVLGLRDERMSEETDRVTPLVDMLLEIRQQAKANKDWATSDKIRDQLSAVGVRVKDRKDGVDWEIE